MNTQQLDIARGTGRGALYSTLGQILLRVVSLAGNVVLARLLAPQDFGIYALTSFLVLQIGSMMDFGLGAKLVHDREPPSAAQQHSVFAFSCIVFGVAYSLLFGLSPWFATVLSLGPGGSAFCRVTGLVLLAYPLRAIPAALLNRNLRFAAIAFAEIAGGVIFQIVAIILARLGFGYWSFGIALLVATVASTLALNLSFQCQLGFCWDWAYLRRSIRFGVAFQASTLTAVARDNIANFLGGPLFGPVAVGLLSWAQRLAVQCSQVYTAVCSNVSFPSLSKLRTDPLIFSAALTRMLWYMNLATFCTLSVASALMPEIVRMVFTDKWLPAVPLFYCFALRMAAANYTTLLDLGIRALGFPERSLRIMLIWTVSEWVASLVAAKWLGFVGIAVVAAVGVWLGVILVVLEISTRIPLELRKVTITPLLSGIITLLLMVVVKPGHVGSLPELAAFGFGGLALYILCCVLLDGPRFHSLIKRDVVMLLERTTARQATSGGGIQ